MKRLVKKSPVLVVPVLLSFMLTPELKAQSGSLDFASSVRPVCVGQTFGGQKCEYVQFTLDVIPDIWVQVWSLFPGGIGWSAVGGPAGVQSLTDGASNDLLGPGGWMAGGASGGSEVVAQSVFAPRAGDPLTMVVRFASWGSPGQLSSMRYTGQGNTAQDGTGDLVSFGGTVAPEPVSIALLATGLLGLGLVARRKEEESLG